MTDELNYYSKLRVTRSRLPRIIFSGRFGQKIHDLLRLTRIIFL